MAVILGHDICDGETPVTDDYLRRVEGKRQRKKNGLMYDSIFPTPISHIELFSPLYYTGNLRYAHGDSEII